MKTYKRFTNEEDLTICETIKNSKSMIEGFTIAAEKLDRTVASVRNHYYKSKEFLDTRETYNKSKTTNKNIIKEILTEEIKKSPNNIKKAIDSTAKKCNLSPYTVSNYYYDKNSYLHKSKLDTCFVVISAKKVIRNSKNCDTSLPVKDKSITFSIKNIFRKIFK